MKPLDPTVSLEEEAIAIVDFINQTWTPIKNLDVIVNEILNVVRHDVRALFDCYVISEHAHKLEQIRKDNIRKSLPPGIKNTTAYVYDSICHLFSEIGLYANRVRDETLKIDGHWDFEKKTKPVHKKLITEYACLKKTRPLGWKALAKNYNEFDGQEEYDPTAHMKLFKGSNIQGMTGSDITGRLALPYVIYGDRSQGRTPSYTLVSAIYAHFMGILEYTNSLKICSALDSLGLPSSHEIVFKLNVQTDNPILKVMMQLASEPYGEQQYLESVAAQEEFNKLPKEEQQQIKSKRRAEMSEEIRKMLSSESTLESDKEELAKSTQIRNLLIQEFGV